MPVPQTTSSNQHEQPIWRDGLATFVSPAYDLLEANVPKEMMQFAQFPFPSGTQLFPGHETVNKYLAAYAEEIEHLVKFRTQVLDVKPATDERFCSWIVKVKDLVTSETTDAAYDAVVVANGHFNTPYIPDVTGIEVWNEAYPGTISHSKFFRNPNAYSGKKVIVVGTAASGLDVTNQVGPGSRVTLVSQRSAPAVEPPAAEWRRTVPEIAEYLDPSLRNRAVRLSDGTVEEDIDAIIYCTGYRYSFPFLSTLRPPLVSSGEMTMNVWQHLFYIQHPTLVLPFLNQRVIPFSLAQNQAAVFSRIWSGRLALPSENSMKQDYEAEMKDKPDPKTFHVVAFPADLEMQNKLYEWAEQAEPREGLERDGKGKEGRRWSEPDFWLRTRLPTIKSAFAAAGEKRKGIRTVKELGFDYEEWLRQEENSVQSVL